MGSWSRWWLLSNDGFHEEAIATGKTLTNRSEGVGCVLASFVLYLLNPVGIHLLFNITKNLFGKRAWQCGL